jgi:ABC-2 type transport system permease protein
MTPYVVRDTGILTGRSVRHILRSPDTILTTVVTPIAMLLLFVYVFGGAIQAGGAIPGAAQDRGRYVDYLLPGILVITVASGTAYTAFRLFTDRTGGIVERFRSMPIARSAILWAHVLTSVVANAVSLVLIVGLALVMGFRSGAGPLAWLAVAGLLILVILALSWLAVIPGLTAGSVDGVSGFSYPLIFLPFVSSAFVPTEGMPAAVRWFAERQPVTPIVDTLRNLMADRPVGTDGAVAVAWCVALLVVAVALAVRIDRRSAGGAAAPAPDVSPAAPAD